MSQFCIYLPPLIGGQRSRPPSPREPLSTLTSSKVTLWFWSSFRRHNLDKSAEFKQREFLFYN